MTDKEVNYRAMARQAIKKLTDYRSVWEKAAPRPVPSYEQVVKLLGDFAPIGTQVAGTGSQGYTDAKDGAVAAAMRVVKGLRNVQLNTYRPELAKAAAYQKSELDGLRDENLVKLFVGPQGPIGRVLGATYGGNGHSTLSLPILTLKAAGPGPLPQWLPAMKVANAAATTNALAELRLQHQRRRTRPTTPSQRT